jgi:hypothetical protein
MKTKFKVTAKKDEKDIEMVITIDTKHSDFFSTIKDTSLKNKNKLKDAIAKMLMDDMKEYHLSQITMK